VRQVGQLPRRKCKVYPRTDHGGEEGRGTLSLNSALDGVDAEGQAPVSLPPRNYAVPIG